MASQICHPAFSLFFLFQQFDVLVKVHNGGILGNTIAAFMRRTIGHILLRPRDQVHYRDTQYLAYLHQPAVGDVAVAGDVARVRTLLDAQPCRHLLLPDVLLLPDGFYVLQYVCHIK